MHGFIHKIISWCKGDENQGGRGMNWGVVCVCGGGGGRGGVLVWGTAAPGATIKWNQQSQAKAGSLKQEPPNKEALVCFHQRTVEREH